MTVLPDHQIEIWGEAGMIRPFLSERVQPASYDCGLDNEFIVFDSHSHIQTAIDLSRVEDHGARKTTADIEGRFVLHPGQFVLASTQETVKIPESMVARIEGKSSIGRLGIMVHVTAGYIDPGFCGQITLEMTNLRNLPIILRVGKPICQLSFHLMESPPAKPYQGRYQNAKGVEASLYGKEREEATKLEWRAEELADAEERVRAGTASHTILPGEAPHVPHIEHLKPFTPRHEAFTCVPHGIYNCPTCLAATTPRASDPEVI
jgi:dCTP deaminase